MKIRNLIYAGLLLLSMASCSNDDFYYQDQARVRLVGPNIYTSGTDSLNFSFVTVSSDVNECTMDVDVFIMGEVADYDRTATIEVDKSKTTATEEMYEVPPTVVIPANANHAVLPVVIKRSAYIQDKSVKLRIQTGSSSDFASGVNEWNHLTLIWTDMLVKPNNWDDLKEFFGSYSNTKYRFMLENSGGVTEFDTDTMSWALLQSYRIKFQNALNDYNSAHPGSPLVDENGVVVSFS